MGEKAWFEEEELLANGKKNLGNRILGWEKDGWGEERWRGSERIGGPRSRRVRNRWA
jgi:hypothetical protein